MTSNLISVRNRIGSVPSCWLRVAEGVRNRTHALRTLATAALRERVTALQSQIHVLPARDDECVIDAFALITESLRRHTGKQFYDVQLLAGRALASNVVAEIQTGEGKTLITSLPAFLHALCRGGVHVATTTDYLASRDSEELRSAFESLGMTVGLLEPQAPIAEKRAAYACDVTFGPGYEFGFDFLRDQIAIRSRWQQPLGTRFKSHLRGQRFEDVPLMQRGQAFTIVDEADSVLIDEAMTPLILSGSGTAASTDPAIYALAHNTASELAPERDFTLDRATKALALTVAGWDRIHAVWHVQQPAKLSRRWANVVHNALRAQLLLERDADYVVFQDQVMIVDRNTGRIHPERTWRAGVHQAVEVKEGLAPSPERETQARVTRQRYSQLYGSMCGLTGTAQGAEAEFREFYDMPVVGIPTHRPCIRKVGRPRFFASKRAKYAAIVQDVRQRHLANQPVLVGTTTIGESNVMSRCFRIAGVEHQVLNGLQDAKEAAIVAAAGTGGTVTIATNMAGRGTDIKLDDGARDAGGLHVVATEFHRSSRIDRQLVGRAARQGDPGSCQSFTSAEDALLVGHSPQLVKAMIRAAGDNGECTGDWTEEIRQLQTTLEQDGLATRRQMIARDEWIESIQETLARQG